MKKGTALVIVGVFAYLVLPVVAGISSAHLTHSDDPNFVVVLGGTIGPFLTLVSAIAFPWLLNNHWAVKTLSSIAGVGWCGYWFFVIGVGTACSVYRVCL